jgi:hypothetical protein
VWVAVHDDTERAALDAHDIDHVVEPFADAAQAVVDGALTARST